MASDRVSKSSLDERGTENGNPDVDLSRHADQRVAKMQRSIKNLKIHSRIQNLIRLIHKKRISIRTREGNQREYTGQSVRSRHNIVVFCPGCIDYHRHSAK